jgi:hypothetical protein
MPDKLRNYTLILIINNSIPLFGVLFFHWDLPYVFIFYWLDAILYCLMRLLTTIFPKDTHKLAARINQTITFLIINSFVLGVYGVGISIFTFTKANIWAHMTGNAQTAVNPSIILLIPYITKSIPQLLFYAVINFVNFIFFYFYKYDKNNQLIKEMQTDGDFSRRLIIMHLTIVVGGIILCLTENTLIPLIVFIIIKSIIEVKYRYAE